jgi:hypothetical protein
MESRFQGCREGRCVESRENVRDHGIYMKSFVHVKPLSMEKVGLVHYLTMSHFSPVLLNFLSAMAQTKHADTNTNVRCYTVKCLLP